MRSADRVAGTPDRTPAGEPDRGPSSLRPFRHRSFTLLWTAVLISTVGSWMQTVAVGALVISDTGSATWAVLVAAGAFLPIGLLSPIGGALADRLPRRPVLAIGNLAAAATALLIAAVATGRDNPGALVALVTLQGSASALIGPFQQAILPDLVPQREFLAATSLNSAQFNLGRIVGPGAGGRHRGRPPGIRSRSWRTRRPIGRWVRLRSTRMMPAATRSSAPSSTSNFPNSAIFVATSVGTFSAALFSRGAWNYSNVARPLA